MRRESSGETMMIARGWMKVAVGCLRHPGYRAIDPPRGVGRGSSTCADCRELYQTRRDLERGCYDG